MTPPHSRDTLTQLYVIIWTCSAFIAYLDDILSYLENAKMHTHDVRKVLERLLKHGVFVKFREMRI